MPKTAETKGDARQTGTLGRFAERLLRRIRRTGKHALAKTPIRTMSRGAHERYRKTGQTYIPGRVHVVVSDATKLRKRTAALFYLGLENAAARAAHSLEQPDVFGTPLHTAFDHAIPDTPEAMMRFAIAAGDQAFDCFMEQARSEGALDDLTNAQACEIFARIELGDASLAPPEAAAQT
ncbi:MAG: hypothetical protein MRY74_03305 [Neomegalonema sp.]|nr:hypothetical protein [Neomegalonema sp.]